MEGILNIDKSPGETSFSVVAAVRRLCRERRVGHAGTLDPLATGVLPVLVGRATRVAEYLIEQPKQYRAEIEFGLTTDSGDADGRFVDAGDVSTIDAGKVASALTGFRGQVRQVPPMFSALKNKGRPLYELARAGISVERPVRSVEIYDIKLVSWRSPVAAIEVTCGRGTYIRTLAQDLGTALGCGGHVKSLCRLRYGPFDLAGAVSMLQLEEVVGRGEWTSLLQPIDAALSFFPAVTLGLETAEFVRHGRPVSRAACSEAPGAGAPLQGGERRRAYSLDGSFLGVLRFNSEKDEWQPEKVFP